MNDHHKEISEDRQYFFEQQEITVAGFDAQGLILDLGGGGEGIIGKVGGDQVVAIDASKRELEGAAPGPLKIVMDGTDLKFLDATFSTVTSFFTLMFVKESNHQKVFSEVFRVLQSRGRFLIWDVIIPQQLDEARDVAVFPLLVRLPGEEINTGYGVLWSEKERGLGHYVRLAKDAEFDVLTQWEKEWVLFLELRKP